MAKIEEKDEEKDTVKNEVQNEEKDTIKDKEQDKEKDTFKNDVKDEINKKEIVDDQSDRKKKKFTIFGFTIWRLLAYFIIYSIVGYIVESLFCIAKYGVFESRQSFLYGPFCAIYGLGAVVMILSLQHFKKNYNTIFIAGAIIGSILEYVISWIGEIIFNVKWWDYSQMPLNLNGRICLLYAIFWGALSLYLIVSLNPKVDKLINWLKKKININVLKTALILFIIGLIFDALITSYALIAFKARIIKEYDLDVSNMEEIDATYNYLYSNEKTESFIYKYFDDETMLKTFPRLKLELSDGAILYFSSILTDIQPFYFRVWDLEKIDLFD